MSDFISREDALNVISDFQFETYGKNDKELTKENQNRWFKAHGMQKLYDRIYQIPCSLKEPEARQVVKQVKWFGETHLCSKCKKIVPFIDWCQPYCSGCGARFKNYTKWVAKEKRKSHDS